MSKTKGWYLVTARYPRTVSNEAGKPKRVIESEQYPVRALSYGDAEYTTERILSPRIKNELDIYNIGKLAIDDIYIEPVFTLSSNDKSNFYSAEVVMRGVGTKDIRDIHVLNVANPEMALKRITKRMSKSAFSESNWRVKNLKEIQIKGIYDADSPDLIQDFELRQDALEDAGFYAAEPIQTTLFNKDGSVKMPNAQPSDEVDALDKYDKINQEGKEGKESSETENVQLNDNSGDTGPFDDVNEINEEEVGKFVDEEAQRIAGIF